MDSFAHKFFAKTLKNNQIHILIFVKKTKQKNWPLCITAKRTKLGSRLYLKDIYTTTRALAVDGATFVANRPYLPKDL